MCASCDRLITELRAELREVKEELEEWRRGDDGSLNDEIAMIARTLKISPQSAKVVNELMSSPSRLVSTERLVEAMGYGGAGLDKGRWTLEGNALKVVMSMARKSLRDAGLHEAISNVWGRGYIMPRSKAVELRAILDAA